MPDAVFEAFGAIPVRTSLLNRSKRTANLKRFFIHAHYGITIKNSNGIIIPPTPEGQTLLHPEEIRGRIDILLKPDEKHRVWLDLRKYFHLPAGEYSLQIGYHITAEYPEGKHGDEVIEKLSLLMKFQVAQKAR